MRLRTLLPMDVVILRACVALLGLLRWPGAWGLASLPAFTCQLWLLGPGLAQLPAPGKQTWMVHTGLLVCDLVISFVHLSALFAVGNSFRQFLLLLLMLTMVGTCLLLALLSAHPRLWGRLCVQSTTILEPLAFPA